MQRVGGHLPQRRSEVNGSEITVRLPVPSALGFLVTSPSLRMLAANEGAATILTYPTRPIAQNLADGFERRMRPALLRARNSGANADPSSIQLKSGRRTYSCRTFMLDGNGNGPEAAVVVVVLERGVSGACALSRVSEQFRLTHREREVVSQLLQGLSNKEMAERLGISINTVKAFLRLVMLKMEVSSRAAITSKIFGLVLSSSQSVSD
ncbi:MAG: helix-turn-helix transcriptional regulator [Acidobacteriia bacterium]|nr:helix-turn-helix transcriptional regulator [Terriglobia bacterium]